MTITQTQRDRRKHKIGSSDVAAILGLDPFRSPADVQATKIHDLDEQVITRPMKLGNYIERGLLSMAADELSLEIRIGGPTRICSAHPLFAANPDAITKDGKIIIEAKTVGMRSPTLDFWGEDGTDEIPDHVELQVQQQMMVTGTPMAIVVGLIAGEMRIYTTRSDDELASLIVENCTHWWDRHITNKHMADASYANLDVLKRIRRKAGKTVEIPEKVALDYLSSVSLYRDAKARRDECKARVIQQMGDAEVALWPCSSSAFTYREQSRQTLDAKELRRDYPTIAEQYTRSLTHRVLRETKLGRIVESMEQEDG